MVYSYSPTWAPARTGTISVMSDQDLLDLVADYRTVGLAYNNAYPQVFTGGQAPIVTIAIFRADTYDLIAEGVLRALGETFVTDLAALVLAGFAAGDGYYRADWGENALQEIPAISSGNLAIFLDTETDVGATRVAAWPALFDPGIPAADAAVVNYLEVAALVSEARLRGLITVGNWDVGLLWEQLNVYALTYAREVGVSPLGPFLRPGVAGINCFM